MVSSQPMPNVPTPPPPINQTANPPSHLPSDAVLQTRNKLLEACALASAVADELGALPADSVSEPLQALMNVCERTCQESFDTFETLTAEAAPTSA